MARLNMLIRATTIKIQASNDDLTSELYFDEVENGLSSCAIQVNVFKPQ